MPGGDFGECIRADDEEGLLPEGDDAFHGVHRIAFALSRFQARGDKARIGLAGQLRHAKTVFIAGSHLIGFMRRMGGWDEPYLVQMELCSGLPGDGEVSVMDRVEGAAEKCESHDLLLPASAFLPGFVECSAEASVAGRASARCAD